MSQRYLLAPDHDGATATQPAGAGAPQSTTAWTDVTMPAVHLRHTRNRFPRRFQAATSQPPLPSDAQGSGAMTADLITQHRCAGH